MGLKQLKAPHRRHLISMVPAIASAADLKSNARHDAHLFETQAESFDECMDALHKPATRMRGCGTASRPTVSWRGFVSSVFRLQPNNPRSRRRSARGAAGNTLNHVINISPQRAKSVRR